MHLIWKENLNSDGQHFHQNQQNVHLFFVEEIFKNIKLDIEDVFAILF
jgi:hypothetical protein